VIQGNSAGLYSSLWEALLGRATSGRYQKGDLLFEHGTPAQGIYLVEEGEVQLTLRCEAKTQSILGTAGPGSILGLSETLSGDVHKLRATVLRPSQISLISRHDLTEILSAHHEFCMHIVHMLSEDLHALYHRFQSMSPKARPRKALQ